MESREQRLIDTFVFLADTLTHDFDADELLHVLAKRCVELLHVDAAGVMLAMAAEELRAVAASSRDMSQLEIFEVAAAEGPSYDAFATGRPTVDWHLPAAKARWPNFAPKALELGFGAAYGFPLRLRDRIVGALNLFQSENRPKLDSADLAVAQGLADVAAIGLLQERLVQDAETAADQLTHALASRVIIEQANGVLSERLGLAPQAAFERMRRHARDHNRKLRDVAQDVVDGRPDGPTDVWMPGGR